MNIFVKGEKYTDHSEFSGTSFGSFSFRKQDLQLFRFLCKACMAHVKAKPNSVSAGKPCSLWLGSLCASTCNTTHNHGYSES